MTTIEAPGAPAYSGEDIPVWDESQEEEGYCPGPCARMLPLSALVYNDYCAECAGVAPAPDYAGPGDYYAPQGEYAEDAPPAESFAPRSADEGVDVSGYAPEGYEQPDFERWSDEDAERFILCDLNPPQREAVMHTSGPLLIVAGPGSGKTNVMVNRIAYLIRVEGVFPWRICAVTFTNKAARELKARIETLLGDDARLVAASTFHSLCARILRVNADVMRLKRDFGIYDDGDQLAVMKRAMTEAGVNSQEISPRAFMGAVSAAKSALVPVGVIERTAETKWESNVAKVYKAYDDLLRLSSALDFDDLLVYTYLLFEAHPEIANTYQQRFRHFMIDEFQDTNIAQYAIARQIGALHRNMCVVGDPDQSIYGWRNADIRNILEFQADYPDATLIALEENYRSSSNILGGARGMISVNTQRVEKDLWTSNGVGEKIAICAVDDDDHEAEFIADEIIAMMDEGKRWSDFAVSYRTNAQARAIEDACMRRDIPYQVIGGLKFYQRQEIKDVLAYLRLIVNPDDEVSFARVVNNPPRGVGAITLSKLTDYARERGLSRYNAIPAIASADALGGAMPLPAKATAALVGFYEMIEELRARSLSVDVPALINETLSRSGYTASLKDDQRGEDRLDNIRSLMTGADDRGSDPFGYESGESELVRFLESVSLSADTDRIGDADDAVTLITLHQAKGLEYPVVFIAGVEEDLLPHKRSIKDANGVEEERRLFYVGMTRAKERLYLAHACERRMYGGSADPKKPSRFLADLPEDYVRRIDLTDPE